MLRALLVSSLIYTTAFTATAQSVDVLVTPFTQAKPHRVVSEWPDPTPAEKLPQSSIDIVTIDQPTIRQRCHVVEIRADSIACRSNHHRADSIYQRGDIAAIIAPPAHENLIGFAEAAGIVAATLTASFFVPFAWCIALRVLSGFFFFAGWAANGITHDQLAAIGYADHNSDILLYQRPNTPLTITLH